MKLSNKHRSTFQPITAASDTSDYYVIAKAEDPSALFIDSRAVRYSAAAKMYAPNFTSIRANNFDRAKKFRSASEAQAFIDKQAESKDLWRYSPVEVMSLSEAMSAVGDPDAAQRSYRQNQADKRKAASKQYAERAKLQNKQNREKSPGTYKVTFWYSDRSLGNETYTVDAESIDDAFKKAKAKALQQDAYRDYDGYDQKMTFNKQNIKKIAAKGADSVASSTQICASYRPVSDPNNLTISELMSRIDMEQPDLWDKAVNYLEKYLDNPEAVWASGYPDWEVASWGISSDAIVSVLEAALETGAVDDMYTL